MDIKNSPLAELTVGQFVELVKEELNLALITPSTDGCNQKNRRLVYGLRGIQDLFGCSHKTAQHLKDHVICEAVSQNGRKIVVDADLALKIFNKKGNYDS